MSYLAVYILFVSSSTFLVFGRDKLRAKQAKSRISERALLLWIACGGGLGALVAMEVFHHKTVKGKFLRKFWLIFLINTLILGGLYYILL